MGTERQEDRVQKLASWLFARRLLAFVIDMALVFGLLWLFEHFIGGEEGVFASERSDITKNVLFSLYMLIVAWAGRGISLGKKITGLRVVQTDMQRTGIFPLLYREFLGRLIVEKFNLIIVFALNITGQMDVIRQSIENPILDTLFLAAISLPWVTFVSCAFALARPDGRTIHDLLSGTMVVKK